MKIEDVDIVVDKEGVVYHRNDKGELEKASAMIFVTKGEGVKEIIQSSEQDLMKLWAMAVKSMRDVDKQLMLKVIRQMVKNGGSNSFMIDVLAAVIGMSGVLMENTSSKATRDSMQMSQEQMDAILNSVKDDGKYDA